jgi:hypothetical protein
MEKVEICFKCSVDLKIIKREKKEKYTGVCCRPYTHLQM